jgi:nanoRNase/pAp phosphatase (c-di-AMP/oligoRNAs hydrolase)
MPVQLEALYTALDGAAQVLILPHTNPDPDAIASAVAVRALLHHVGLSAQIGYRGVIGRAENRALVRYLGRPLRRLRRAEVQQAAAVVLVDTQPGAGNCALDPGVAVRAVIDHHPGPWVPASDVFVDIRPALGATATILMEYLQAAHLPLSRRLATALFYGIKSDTAGLIRGASAADVATYLALVPQIDQAALLTIEQAPVPVAYFRQLYAAVQAAQVYEEVIIVNLGRLAYPDLTAEVADWLLRLEGMQWSVCLGVYERRLLFSVRTRRVRGGAGQVAQAVVAGVGSGGGHGMLAGGEVPLQGQATAAVAAVITQRVLAQLGKARTVAAPLIQAGGGPGA